MTPHNTASFENHHLVKPKPYSLHDLIKMKRGDLIGGFTTDDNGCLLLSPVWQDVPNAGEQAQVQHSCMVEGTCGFRVALDWKPIGTVKLAKPTNTELTAQVGIAVGKETCVPVMKSINFRVGYPVGVFMGYLLRDDDTHTFVNVLTLCGLDVWIG